MIADNKNLFRRYGGIDVLIDVFEKLKSEHVARALEHVLKGNGKSHIPSNSLYTLAHPRSFCSLGLNIVLYCKRICTNVGSCFCHGPLDEGTVISFLKLLDIARNGKGSILYENYIKGIVNSVEPLILNREVGLSFLKLFSQSSCEDSNHYLTFTFTKVV